MFCFKVSSVLRCVQILEIVHFSVFGLFDRNVEIDKEIDRLIQEKLNNKEKIEQLSSFNKG